MTHESPVTMPISMKEASNPTVIVEAVSKRYRLRESREGLRGMVGKLGRRMLGRAPRDTSTDFFYAVKDLSFQVAPGQTLGLVGHNGAGKTTTLKLLSRITRPTTGQIKLNGRFSSLIELGAGFHPDLTGRENVFLNGVILGLSREQIKRKFDEIVGFAELEKFIDMPVKRYSSGMYARLGFSVAAHVNPDIMLVDEVLAVGDASFQRRCYDFIHAFVKSGKTTVFVSHNLYVIEQLCDRVAWLERGQVVKLGTPNEVLPAYLDSQDQKALAAAAKFEQVSDVEMLRAGEGQLRILGITFTDVQGQTREAFQQGEDVVIQVRYQSDQPIEQPHFVFGMVDAEGGRPLFLASMLVDGAAPRQIHGEGSFKLKFKQVPLMPRTYYVWGEVWAADRARMLVKWQRIGGVRVASSNTGHDLEVMGKGSIRHTRADAPIRVAYEWEF